MDADHSNNKEAAHPDSDEGFQPWWSIDSDLIETGCTLYPVFCTVDIPSATLSSYIKAVRRQTPPDDGGALCILTSMEASDYDRGTRAPMRTFMTPFKGKCIKNLRKIFDENFNHREGWSEECFVVLDDQFLGDGTALLVSSDKDFDTEDEKELESLKQCHEFLNFRCDGLITLEILTGWEMNRWGGRPWHADDWGSSDAGGYVFTNEEFESRVSGQ